MTGRVCVMTETSCVDADTSADHSQTVSDTLTKTKVAAFYLGHGVCTQTDRQVLQYQL